MFGGGFDGFGVKTKLKSLFLDGFLWKIFLQTWYFRPAVEREVLWSDRKQLYFLFFSVSEEIDDVLLDFVAIFSISPCCSGLKETVRNHREYQEISKYHWMLIWKICLQTSFYDLAVEREVLYCDMKRLYFSFFGISKDIDDVLFETFMTKSQKCSIPPLHTPCVTVPYSALQ